MSKEISRRQFNQVLLGLGLAAVLGCQEKVQRWQVREAERTATRLPAPTATSTPEPTPPPIIEPTPTATFTPEPQPQPTSPLPESASISEPLAFEVATTPDVLSPHFTALKEALISEVQSAGPDVAVVVGDLLDGEKIAINGNAKHLTGCTINIFPFLSVLEDLQNGKYELDSNLAYNLHQGIPLSQPHFVVPLLEKSGGTLSGGVLKANELRERIGAKNSFMDHEPLYGGTFSLAGSDNYFTANDANLVLTKLWRGEILNPKWSAFAIEELTKTNWTVDFILASGIPDHVKVAHKIGWHWDPTGYVENDIGFAIAQKEGKEYPFAISYFSQNGSHKGAGSVVGQNIAQLSWQHFAQKYNLS